MNDIKEQLCLKYPFLRKSGEVYNKSPDLEEIVKQNRGERILILMVGVEGSGKTTYCEKHFSGCTVVNADELLKNCLHESDTMSLNEASEAAGKIFFERVRMSLRREGLVVIDAGNLQPTFRIPLLQKLQGRYTKAIMLVLNPSMQQIRQHVNQQIEIRERPGMWSEISEERKLLQYQIQNKILEMGMNEVYMV